MKRLSTLMLAAPLIVGIATAQKIETRKSDRQKITRLETALNHLSVIELGEEVAEVAVGSNAYKVEWRENKVFIQPLEPNSQTNLFIWTKSGRLNYELAPGSVETMHFAIDEEPSVAVKAEVQPAAAQAAEAPKIPSDMLLHGKPVTIAGARAAKNLQNVEVILTDIYRTDGKLYLRYNIRNHGNLPYRVSAPAVYSLESAKSNSQSLVPLKDSQLVGDLARLSSDAEVTVPVVFADAGAQDLGPGEVSAGLVAFEEPPFEVNRKRVVKLEFPRRNDDPVVAFMVL